MDERFQREALLIGESGVEVLHGTHVALFGVGGVGSYAAEALARAGIGHITLIDSDCVSKSNINRQLCALDSTVGRPKVEVVAERLRDINPCIEVITRQEFYLSENADSFDFSGFDYIIDAIDTVSAKLSIAERAQVCGVAVISCMGTGNKLDPTALCVTDISKTDTCPLARVMRRELKKRGISHLKVVYSKEEPTRVGAVDEKSGRAIPASISFVPPVAGLIAAGEAIKDILAVNWQGEVKNG